MGIVLSRQRRSVVPHLLPGVILAISCTISNAAPPLLLQYGFDEPAGLVLDQGQLNPPANGVLQGDATRTGNTPGGFSAAALDLNGISTDFVLAADPDKLDNLTSYSIALWFNLRETYLGTGRILGKHDLFATGFDLITAPSNASGFTSMSASEFSLGLMHETGMARSTADVDAENRWVFLGMTFDGTADAANLRFYVGNETTPVAALGAALDLPHGPTTSNGIDFTVGGAGPIIADLTLPGRIDDVRIYGDVLSQSSLEILRRKNLTFVPDGDFNDDLVYDCVDIDLLTQQIASGFGDLMPLFDLTQDGQVDQADLDAWLAEAGAANLQTGAAYAGGDANLDGAVDVSDFGIWNSHKFTDNANWCSGDFNADGGIDVSDFNLWSANKFTVGGQSLPEPHTFPLLLIAAGCLLRWLRPQPALTESL